MGSCFTTPEQTAQQRIDKWIQQGNITRPLDLIGLNLTSIPEGILPPTLQTLLCYHNKLTSLPALPPTLQKLDCDNNQLTNLPVLPSSLQTLWCCHNQLTSLPTLPPTLRHLYCAFNKLTSLPTLPPTLQELWCCRNQLTSIPSLPPIINTLTCRYNLLTSLPTLPHTLQYLYYHSNPLTTQPNWPRQQGQQIQQQIQQQQPLPKRIIDSIIRDAIINKETCPILQEPLQENAYILTTCFHVFSKEGFAEWSKKSSECPTCRQKCSVMV